MTEVAEVEKQKEQLEKLLKEAMFIYGITFQVKEPDGNWYDIQPVLFKPMFDVNAVIRVKPVNTPQVVEHFEAYGMCRDSKQIAYFEGKLEQAKEIIRKCIEYLDRTNYFHCEVITEAEQFLKEIEK